MKKKYLSLWILLCLFFFLINAFSQDYISDTLAVRAILDSNGLDTIPVHSVTDSSNGRISSLYLRFRNLTFLPLEIGNLTALEILYIPENKLTSLPPEISNLNNLLAIWLDNNNLSYIPIEIFNIISLKLLYIPNNNLTSLPSEIEKLTNLILLDVKENDLSNLPPELGNMANLQDLYLQHNNLTTLPDSIVKLTPTGIDSLEYGLDLGYNKLDTNNLSDIIKAWADRWDHDWRNTQNTPIIYNSNSVINPNGLSINTKNESISFNLSTSGNVKLQLYNMKGILLLTLVNSYKQAGIYCVNWDNKRYGSGVYFIKLTANGSAVSKKFTITN